MSTTSVVLLKDDIPVYLSSSPYLLSLVADEEFPVAGIEVPADCCKADTSVLNVSDLEYLLKTVRFWLVPELLVDLEELHMFTFDPKNAADVIQVLNNFKTELPHVNILLLLVSGNMEAKLVFAASRGLLTLLDFLCQIEKFLSHLDRLHNRDNILCSAAKEGRLLSLQVLCVHGWPCSARVLSAAAENGHMDCMKFILGELDSAGTDIPAGDLFAAAAKGGQVFILKYLLETFGVPEEVYQQQRVWSHAASGGHLETLEYLYTEKFNCDKRYAFIPAAQHGHVAALEYLINKFGVPDREEAEELWVKTATAGQLPVLKYLQKHVSPLSFAEAVDEPCDSLIYASIVPNGIPCIDYLRALGHPWHIFFTLCAAEYGLVEVFQYLFDSGCPCNSVRCSYLFAKAGSLEGLKCILERELPWSAESCEVAAEKGHLECLTFLVENGCPLNLDKICSSAAFNLSCLTYAHQRGGQLTVAVAIKAAQAGALDCLQYLHAQGCVFTVEVANACTKFLSPECLQFVLDTGCPVSEITCQHAAMRLEYGSWKGPPEQQLACLKLLHERGCPWDETTCIAAVNSMNVTVLQFAIEHGCPWGPKTRSGAVSHCALYLESITNS